MNKDLSLHRPALYNPALWSRDELKTYYIARQPLLTRLVDDLRRERPGSRPQHRLILGVRGMGKSTLLRRLAVAVEDDTELTAQWLPLTFPEEQYNVGVLADFWLNCLDALSDLLEGRNRIAEAKQIDGLIEGLARQDHEGALQALIKAAKRLDRRLLLLIDNIDLILDRLKDKHWVLREILQSHSEILVVGASARALEASYQYDAAFYDFFKVDELRGLSEQEMRDTLLALARLRGVPEVERRITAEPSRIRILHILTGGNPRTVVLLYGVLLKGMDGDVRADLEGLLDEVTPLYKARFEELPAQGQQLLDKLALYWDPMTARQLADALNWDVNLVSAQLNRLTQLGIVEKVKSGSGKRAAFQVGERFFNIWYLMRASRRVRRKLVWLVEFLGIWYSGEELRRSARTRLSQGASCERDAEYHLALSRALKSEPLARALETQALYALIDADNRAALEEILDLRGEDRPLLPKVERIKELKALRKAVSKALEKVNVDFDKQLFVERLLGSVASINLRSSLLNDAAKLSSVLWQNSDAQLQKEWIDLQRFYGHSVGALYQAIACGEIGGLDDQEGVQAASERFECPLLALIPRLQDAHAGKPTPEEAEQTLNQALAFEPEAAGLWNRLGILLIDHLSRQAEAEAAYRKAIELDPKLARTWFNLGILLQNHLHRFEDAEAAYCKAIELDPKDALPWNNLGLLLKIHLHRFEDAEAAYRKAIDLDPKDALPWNNLGLLLHIQLHRFEDAEAAYRKAIELDPKDALPWCCMAWLLYKNLIQTNWPEEAVEAVRQAFTRAPNDIIVLHSVAFILLATGNTDEALPHCRRLFDFADDDFFRMASSSNFLLFQTGLKAGTGVQFLQAIDDSGAGERWRPLREALAAAVAGKAEILLDVAPEVRKPALEILAIIAPDLPISPALR